VDDDEYVAYCFNQAVTYVGKFIDSKVEEAGEKAKNAKAAEGARQRVLDKYLAMNGKAKPESNNSGFMDPAAMIF
jgi:hypothetical protein